LAFGSDLDPVELVKFIELFTCYTDIYKHHNITTLSVEKRFKDINGFMCGSIDVLAKMNDKYVIIEHKTTTQDIGPTSSYWDRVTSIDSQLSTYVSAAKEMGYDVQEIVYDVIHRPRSGPYKSTPKSQRKYTKAGNLYAGQRDVDETLEEYRERLREDIKNNPEFYFQRKTIVRLESELLSQDQDNRMTDRMIDLCEKEEMYPRNTGSCFQFGRKCDYWDVCNGTESINNDNIFRTAKVPHEELE
jgi:hypothetical protein